VDISDAPLAFFNAAEAAVIAIVALIIVGAAWGNQRTAYWGLRGKAFLASYAMFALLGFISAVAPFLIIISPELRALGEFGDATRWIAATMRTTLLVLNVFILVSFRYYRLASPNTPDKE